MPTVQESIDSLHVEAQALEDIINGPSAGVGSEIALSGGGTQDSVAKVLLAIGTSSDYLNFGAAQAKSASEKTQALENLGIPQVREFYDDFDRADTSVGVVSDAPGGETYIIRDNAGTSHSSIQIVGGEIIATPDQTYYIGGEFLANDCYNMGAEIVFEKIGTGITDPATLVFLIKNTTAWLGEVIHIRVNRVAWYIEFFHGTDLGEGTGSEVLASGNWGNNVVDPYASGDDATSTRVEVIIEGDTMHLFAMGTHCASVTDSRITSRTINGKHVFWERAGGDVHDDLRIRSIWANDSRPDSLLLSKRTQPYSDVLSSLAQGYLKSWNGGEITNADFDVLNGNITIPAGSMIAQNIKRDIEGSTSTLEVTGGLAARYVTAVANTSAGITTFSNANRGVVPGVYLEYEGDKIVFIFEGTYAANADSKHIKFDHAGLVGDALVTTQNGGAWQMRAEVGHDSGEANRTLVWSFIDDRGAQCGRATAAASGGYALGASVIGGLKLAGTNIGDVTCETASRELHQMPK